MGDERGKSIDGNVMCFIFKTPDIPQPHALLLNSHQNREYYRISSCTVHLLLLQCLWKTSICAVYK